MPVEPFSPAIADILADQLSVPAGQSALFVVSKWNSLAQAYVNAYIPVGAAYGDSAGQAFADPALTTLSDMELAPGDGFMLQNPSALAQSLTLAGPIVLTDEEMIPLYPGLSLVGYPYSSAAEVDLGYGIRDTGYGTGDGNMPDSSTTSPIDPTSPIPNPASQTPHPKSRFSPGIGTWLENSGTGASGWTVPRPYADLFTGGAPAPAIAAIATSADGVTLDLDASVSGTRQAILLTKDLTNGQALVTAGGWSVAGEVRTSGRDSTYFRIPAQGADVAMRCVLAADALLDSDFDGIPDAVETFVHGTSPTAIDTDGDGISDAQELAAGTDPLVGDAAVANVIYVDVVEGDDDFTGKASKRGALVKDKSGKSKVNGPLKRMARAIADAKPGDTIYVASGIYPEGRVELPAGVRMVAVGRVELQ